MRQYYHYHLIRKTIIMFLDMFNDMQIARYDNAGAFVKLVAVPLKFGTKEKAWYFLKEKRRTEEMLPIMAVNMASIDFAPERMGNKNEYIRCEPTGTSPISTLSLHRNAIPYNITVNLNIWALYITDVDQILEMILPYFTPHSFIRVHIPEVDTTVEVKVVLQGCTPDITEDYGEEDWRVIKWTLTFVLQTYVFTPATDVETVEKIMANIATGDTRVSTTSLFTSAAPSGAAETVYLEGLGFSGTNVLFKYEIFD